jgi:molybdopterin synthase catalytic subunit/molybdopterin converting factor small subunit
MEKGEGGLGGGGEVCYSPAVCYHRTTMKVRLLAFASAGDAIGTGELELDLPEGSRVDDLRLRLAADFPRLAPLWPRLAVAVDGKLVGGAQALTDGAEVALLPPVSGGIEGRRVALVDGPIEVGAVIELVRGSGRGAVVLFLGTVRDHHAGRRVEKLTYSAYRSMAEEVLSRIVVDLERSSSDLRAAIVHRLGEVWAGEPSVAIAVAAPHRAEGYDASRAALERLKSEAPIWKREHYASGDSAWREEEPLTAAPVRSLPPSD